MGKIKRTRHVLHAPAPRSKCTGDVSMMQVPVEMCESSEIPENHSSEFCGKLANFSKSCGSGIFSNIDISPALLNQKLPDRSDNQSVMPCKSTGIPWSKKAKRDLRHNLFLKKLEATKVLERKKIESEKRKNTPVVGDMTVLSDALPTLELLLKKKSCEDHVQAAKPRVSQSFKQQQKAMLNDIATFRQVLKDPSYIADPIGTIATHVQYSLQQQKTNSSQSRV